MAAKPCQLVLIKRFPREEELRAKYPPEYCAGLDKHWVAFQSNAMLFNKSDVRREVMPQLPQQTQHYIRDKGQIVETVFEMVELIEKKSFGVFVVRLTSVEEGVSVYDYVSFWREGDEAGEDSFWYTRNPSEAKLFDLNLKNEILTKMNGADPIGKLEAQELFTQ